MISKKKVKGLYNNLGEKVLELSQIQSGFAKMIKLHRNLLGN